MVYTPPTIRDIVTRRALRFGRDVDEALRNAATVYDLDAPETDAPTIGGALFCIAGLEPVLRVWPERSLPGNPD